MFLGSSSVSHTSMGDEDVHHMLEKLEKSALIEGDSDLEVSFNFIILSL